MFNQYISREALSVIAVFIFLILFGIINALRPSVIYNKDLSFRRFGIGYKNKTVIPIWLFSIVLAILVYVAVTYFFEYKAVD
jgi:fumarate reductase subunit C